MAGQESTIDVELRLRDLATKELKQFNSRIKKAGSTAGKAFKQVSREAKRSIVSLGKLAGAAAGVFIAFKAGQKALRAGFGFVDAASDAEESFSKFAVVFGSESDRIEGAIDGMAKAMGRSRFELIKFAGGLQDTFVPLGFARRDAADLSLALVALATDVASFSNRADADVIRDFTSALTGSSETVKKYGIILNEVKIAQEALNLGLVESGEEMTDLAKTAARASLIFKGTSDAQGDAQRTSAGWANTMKRLEATVGVLRVEVGNFIKDELLDLIKDMGGADEITRKLAIGFQIVGVATVGLVRIFARVAESAADFVDSMEDGGRGVLLNFGKFLLRIETLIRKLIASFPAVSAEIVSMFQTLRGELAKARVDLELFVNEVISAFNSIPVLADVGLVDLTSGIDAGQLGRDIESAGKAADDVMTDLIRTFADLDAAEVSSIERLESFTTSVVGAGDEMSTMAEKVGEVIATKKGLNDFMDDFLARVKNVNSEVGVLKDDFGTFAVPLEGGGDKAPRDIDLFREAQAAKAAAIALGEYNAMVNDMINANLLAASSFDGAVSSIERYAASLSNFQLAANFTSGLFQTFEAGLSRFSRDLVKGEADFADFAKSMIQNIGALIVQFLLLRAVRSGLGIDASGGLAGGGLLGAIGFAEKGGVFHGQMGAHLPINSYAGGGVANSPQLAVFGEGRGAEAFVPLPDGKNIPVKLEGGGAPAIINLTVQSLDPTTAADTIIANAAAIREVITSALESGSDRQLSKAVGG